MSFPEAKKFSILDHLDRLEINDKKSSRSKIVATCPCCGEDNLKIDSESGKYQCFSGCETPAIREAIKPWSEVVSNAASTKPAASLTPAAKPKPKAKPKPAALPLKIHLAKIEGEIKHPQAVEGKGRKAKGVYYPKTLIQHYEYSPTQRIERVDYFAADGQRARKDCYYQHLTPGSGWISGKGDQPWLPYRLEDVSAYAQGRFVLAVEGEKCVEAGRSLRLPSVSFRDDKRLEDDLKALMEAGAGGLVYCPDNDQPGKAKAAKVTSAAAAVGLPLLVLSLDKYFEEAAMDGGDLADVVQARLESGGGVEAIMGELEAAIELELEAAALPKAKPAASDEDDEEFDPFAVVEQSVELLIYREHFGGGVGDWVVMSGNFYHYTKLGFWRLVEAAAVKYRISRILIQCYRYGEGENECSRLFTFATQAKLNSTYSFLLSALAVCDRPQNDNLIAFGNCTLDTSTGETLPHNKDHYLTWAIPTDYQTQSHTPPLFEQFVTNSCGVEFLPIIRAWISSILDPSAPYGKFIHAIGPSGSGKGTLLRLIAGLLPPESVARLESFADISSPEKRHQFLSGSRLCLFPDLGGFQRSLQALYELVDNGGLSGRGLFSPDGYSRQWNCKFMMASVEHLPVENTGDGMQRRAILIPFKRRRGAADAYLESKLSTERGAIIAWALGLDRSERDHLLATASEHPAIAAQAREAAIYGDSVRSFLDAAMQPVEYAVEVSGQELHQLYTAYCAVTGSASFGYQKFIGHLKNLIPDHLEPSRVVKESGRTVRLPAHWFGLDIVEGAFIATGQDHDGSTVTAPHLLGNCAKSDRNISIECVKGKLSEGNLARFEGVEEEETLPAADSPPQPVEVATEETVEETVETRITAALIAAKTVIDWQNVATIEGFADEVYHAAKNKLSPTHKAKIDQLATLYTEGRDGYRIGQAIAYRELFSSRGELWLDGSVVDISPDMIQIQIVNERGVVETRRVRQEEQGKLKLK